MSVENNFEQELDSHDARTDFKNVLQGILEKANAEERLVSDHDDEKDSSNEDFSKGIKVLSSSPQKPTTPRATKRRKRREEQRFERQKSRDILNQDKELHRKTEFFTGFRFTPELFDLILKKVSGKITKQRTQFRRPISATERLAITLRFLTTGDSYTTIGSAYCVSKAVLCQIIPSTCAALWDVLQPEVLPPPNEQTWKESSISFKMTFPHCVGALDGKHVAVHASSYGKSSTNLVVMAVCDAQFNVLAADVSDHVFRNDECLFQSSLFGKMLLDQKLPSPQPLSEAVQNPIPFVYVGSDVFPLCHNLMRPFQGPNLCQKKLIFNHRLSEARRVIEQTFGLMFSHFRVLRKPITLSSQNAIKVIKAIIILHNFLLRQLGAQYASVQAEDPVSITGAFSSLPRRVVDNAAEPALIRDVFAKYFCSQFIKECPLQEKSINAEEANELA